MSFSSKDHFIKPSKVNIILMTGSREGPFTGILKQKGHIMEKLTTLGAVFDKVDALSANCYDQNIKVRNISFESLDTIKIGSDQHKMRTVAQRSISNRLGVPFQYLRKCPPDIQAENLNYWIQHEKSSELLFRFDSEEVRAIFSLRYRPCDNFEVMERLDSLGYSPETEVQF